MTAVPSATLAALSAHAMVDLVRSRQVSPVELVQAVLDRIDGLDPDINAFAKLDAEGALAAARAAEAAVVRGDRLGPLHGVPVSIKDIQAVAGLPTRRGSRLTSAEPAAADAPVVARLRAAGAIILGKTAMPEYGWVALSDSPLTGATRNPWRPDCTAGGSSSGAAALAAAGCGPLHLGTDGAGSVRLPAHFCGVVGFKPTYGTVPYVPVPNNGALSHIGPIARDVADAELMLAVMSGPHPGDFTSLAGRFTPLEPRNDLTGLRVAYSADLGHAQVDQEVADLVAAAAIGLEEMGAEVEALDPPWGRSGPELIRSLWGAAYLGMAPTDPGDEALMDRGLVCCQNAAAGLTAREVQAAHGRRISYAADVGTWFAGGFDILVTPAASVAAVPLGRLRPEHWPAHDWDWLAWAEFSYPFNLAHAPAISVPCGRTKAGLPVGIQLAGPRHVDALVLQVAGAFLRAFPVSYAAADGGEAAGRALNESRIG